jgi:hypothetical protein
MKKKKRLEVNILINLKTVVFLQENKSMHIKAEFQTYRLNFLVMGLLKTSKAITNRTR